MLVKVLTTRPKSLKSARRNTFSVSYGSRSRLLLFYFCFLFYVADGLVRNLEKSTRRTIYTPSPTCSPMVKILIKRPATWDSRHSCPGRKRVVYTDRIKYTIARRVASPSPLGRIWPVFARNHFSLRRDRKLAKKKTTQYSPSRGRDGLLNYTSDRARF